VVVLASAEGAALLANNPAAKDFVSDAHAHCKYIGYTPETQPLLDAAGIKELDDGYVALGGDGAIATFLQRCRTLRYWERTPNVRQP
jgi:catalase